MRVTRGWGWALAALLFFCAPAVTQAQGTDGEARALFGAGEIAYSEGRYEAALEYFQRAYDLSGRPLLLYNIGSAAEHLRRDAEALAAFERYLAEVGDEAPHHAAVAARIEILRASVAASSAGGTEVPVATTEATEEPVATTEEPVEDGTPVESSPPAAAEAASSAGPGAAPWIVVGVGAAVAVAGAVLVGVGYADGASVTNIADGGSWSSVSGAYERAPILEGVGFALLGAGVAAAVGGAVWGAIGGGGETATATAWASPDGAGIVVGGSF